VLPGMAYLAHHAGLVLYLSKEMIFDEVTIRKRFLHFLAGDRDLGSEFYAVIRTIARLV